MLNQNNISTDYRSLLGLTSLTAAEFFQLLEPFDKLWQFYHAHHDLQGKWRRIEKFSEHGTMSLKGSLDKLFFVLVYLKQHPLQSYYGITFAMSQSKVSQWLKVLLPLLEQVLAKMRLLPCREPSHLYVSLRLLGRYFGSMPLKGRCLVP